MPPTSAAKSRKEKAKIAKIDVAPEPVEVAEDAGLRYVSDDEPGYTRKRKRGDFEYFDTEGKRIRDEARLLRIRRLATQANKNIKDAIAAVSKILGNTPTICRKCYVHPAVLENYLGGGTIEGLKQKTEQALSKKLRSMRAEEAAVMSFLQARLKKKK